jgi:hypothetical protein
MIVFGTRGTVLRGKQLDSMTCASCGQSAHATFGVLRHFHVFWIPVFPTQLSVGTECLHCKKTLLDKELPEPVRARLKGALFTRKTLLPRFAGLALFAVLVAFVAHGGREKSRREAAFLERPAVGDLYVVTLPKLFGKADAAHPYGILKVASVAEGRVEVVVANVAWDRAAGPRKAIRQRETDRPDYFDPATRTFEAAELKQLKAGGALQEVTRR